MEHSQGFRAFIDGRSEGGGRVFQQGGGYQFNAENLVFAGQSIGEYRTPPGLDEFAPSKISGASALELGVHRTESLEEGGPFDLPVYIERNIDRELRSHLLSPNSASDPILIIGDSTAGKSRAAYEAMLACFPEAYVFAPIDGPELRTRARDLVYAENQCILWLDNLERYIGPDGLTPDILRFIRRRRIPVIATMRAEQFRRFSPSHDAAGLLKGDDHGHALIGARVLELMTPIILSRLWTKEEIGRAGQISDRRVAGAVAFSKLYGIAEYLASGPRLYQEWSLGWGAGLNPRGAAIVAAAVDFSRAGISGFLPKDLLVGIHEVYLSQVGGALLRPEPLEDAIEWAARYRFGITSLLLSSNDGESFRAFDYLPDALARSHSEHDIPDEVWDSVLNFARDTGKLYHVGLAAASMKQWSIAERAWKEEADSGSPEAQTDLGRLYRRTGREDLACEIWLQASENGSIPAGIFLGSH